MDIEKVQEQVLYETYEPGTYFSINTKGENVDIKVFTRYRFNIVTHHSGGTITTDMYAYNTETKEWSLIS